MIRLGRNILLLLFLLPFCALAQVPTDSTEQLDDDGIDQVIEDAINQFESDDQTETDWSDFTDYLNDLKKRPLNLNRASKAELLMLPGMDEILATSLLNYTHEFGVLSSIYELQAVPGFDINVFRKIRPYVVVREGEVDEKRDYIHAKGPSLKTILDKTNHEIMFRFVSLLEEQKGYTEDTTGASRYKGNRHKYYTRYRMRYERNFSLAFVGEKDQGEEFRLDPSQNYYGFDFMAGHIFIKDFGHVKRAVVGDYNIQCGQGLILSTGLGFGKGSETVSAVKRSNLGIRPFSSVNENQFLRGAATTLAWKNVYLTSFYSRNQLDANITSTDSSEFSTISALQTSGLHRTESELADKDAIDETMFGGRLEYKTRWLNLGLTHVFQNFGAFQDSSNKDYQLYKFTGNKNYLTGFDFDLTLGNVNFFGEIARSKSGGTGAVVGLMAALGRKLDFSLLFRNFDKDFHSNRGYAFAERPTTIQNEQGIYMGLKLMPNNKWTISSYFDQFKFPWHNYQASFPSKGHEFLAQVQYKPNRKMLIYTRYRSDHKERNASDLAEGQQLEVLIPTVKQALRLHFQYKVHRTLTVKTRVEGSRFSKEGTTSKGFLAYQDLSWKLGWKWKLTGRYAVFNSEDYNSRIYAYENDILGFFSIPAYYGTGSRYYLIVNYKPTRWLEFWARFSRTEFYNDKTIGSGLTEIQGNQKSEVKLQMRLKF